MKLWVLLFVFVWIVIWVLKALFVKKGSSSGSLSGLFRVSGLNEEFMKAAGTLGFTYVRPVAGGFPGLSGGTDVGMMFYTVEKKRTGSEEVRCCLKFARELPPGVLFVKDSGDVTEKDFMGKTKTVVSFLSVREGAATPEAARFLNGSADRKNVLKNLCGRFAAVHCTSSELILYSNQIPETEADILDVMEKVRDSARILIPEEPQKNTPKPSAEEPIKPKEPKKPVVKTEPIVKTEPVVETELTVERCAETLFGSVFPGEKEKQLFEGMKGKNVTWSGELISAYEFGNDFELGAGPAVRASFTVAELSGNYSMKSRIKAIVRLPIESLGMLKDKTGKTVEFSGMLYKVEFFAKELILTAGTVLRSE